MVSVRALLRALQLVHLLVVAEMAEIPKISRRRKKQKEENALSRIRELLEEITGSSRQTFIISYIAHLKHVHAIVQQLFTKENAKKLIDVSYLRCAINPVCVADQEEFFAICRAFEEGKLTNKDLKSLLEHNEAKSP